MLAVFRRYTFRLDEATVSQALFSVLGGSSTCFHVRRESERQFRFSVASKAVGYMVYNLRRVIARHFDVYFHLWRDGGADWRRDQASWEKEEEDHWTVVTSKQSKKMAKKVSFANPLKQGSLPSKFKPALPATSIQFGAFNCSINLHGSSYSSSLAVMVFQGSQFQISNRVKTGPAPRATE